MVSALALFVIVAIDQAAKLAIIDWLGPDAARHRWEFAGKYLAIHYVENRGAAFGLLAGQTTLLIVLAIAVGIGFIALLRQDLQRNVPLRVALVLIIAGAIGNLIDRIRYGYVVDFIAVGIWPKFNVADACITIAIGIVAWSALFPSPAAEPDAKEPLRD
jgi:signal peptidase II